MILTLLYSGIRDTMKTYTYIDSLGLLRGQIPKQAIDECTSDDTDTYALTAKWVSTLNFGVLDMERVRRHLGTYGKWTDAELEALTYTEIVNSTFYIVCWDLAEHGQNYKGNYHAR